MSSNLFLGLAAAVSMVGLSEVAAARPCLLGPDDRPATARDAPAFQAAAKRHGRTILSPAKTPDSCELEPPVARTMLKGRKPAPRMLAPQRADH